MKAAIHHPSLDFQNVSVHFPQKPPYKDDLSVIENVSLSVHHNEFVSVIGPSGCGKSTLLNIASGLMTPTDGIIKTLGSPLSGINKHAGYMFQVDTLIPWKTTFENIISGLIFRGTPTSQAQELGMNWLEKIGLTHAKHFYSHQLSGGMKKRVALAQMLILNPKILLMDEPFSALDVQTRQLMIHEVMTRWELEEKAVLFVTHDLDEALALSDRIIVFSAGPSAKPIAEFCINLPKPREVTEIHLSPEFLSFKKEIWHILKKEVQKNHEKNK